jgi:hypothetical protein
MYWRKANAIHRWFVEECQNGVDECQMTRVHPEALMDLLDRCERIAVTVEGNDWQDYTGDRDLANDLLPSQAGFFFGGTDYDSYYFGDIKDTAVDLKGQVELLMPHRPKFYYRSSW